ncbi:hypothetical protein [Candidatus Leptofilum sp.]
MRKFKMQKAALPTLTVDGETYLSYQVVSASHSTDESKQTDITW